MKLFTRLASVVGVATVAVAALAGSANAATTNGGEHDHAGHVVFVQTDNKAGNQIVAYDRADNGSLTLAGTYDTGGLGGQLTARSWTIWRHRAP